MSNFLGLSRDRSMNVAGDDGQSQSLSDETMVQDTPWKVLKQFAMQAHYKKSSWYKSYTKEEQGLVDRLVKAQQAQGDNLELKAQLEEEPEEDVGLLLAKLDSSNQNLSL